MNIHNWYHKYETDCDLKYPSQSTRRTYKSAVMKFLEYFKSEIEPKSIPNQKIKDWLLTFTTHNTRKQMQCSVNSFYKMTVKMPSKIANIPYPKKQKTLPRVIDTQCLIAAITKITNLKHKAILMLAYSCALRVSEVINLKIEHIDSTRMIIHIHNGKGNKDRIVKLSKLVLETLRAYFRQYKPSDYLFNGQNKTQYTAISCGKLVKKYIAQDTHFHQLRHSGATAMLEAGTDISIIQKLLGHANIKTTMIYTHVSNNLIQQVKTPM